MKLAILTVVYPAVEPYIYDYLNSLSNQTKKNFTLYLVDDEYPNLEKVIGNFQLSVNILAVKGSPGSLRKSGIKALTEAGVEGIIFADADDYFAENRVEISAKMLADNDIIVNDLIMVGDNILKPSSMFGKRLQDNTAIEIHSMKKANCMGLSNTALRTDKISSKVMNIPDYIIAFDWLLFSLCIHDGAKAIYTDKTKTYYRQHSANIASPNAVSGEQIMRGVRVKRDHYNVMSKFYNEYHIMAKTYERLYDQLQIDAVLKEEYCIRVKKQMPLTPLWWEPIQTLEELGL